MARLIFIPWYNVVNPVTIGRYNLIPFDTRVPNPTLVSLDQQAKVILKNYLTQPFTSAQLTPPLREQPVKTATLITMAAGDFNQSEVEILQYVISLAGISDREFVDTVLYLCSDNFKIVIQNFPVPIPNPFDPLIVTNTKTGQSANAFTQNLFREVKPWHVATQTLYGNIHYRLKFNEPLAQCLWQFCKSTGVMQSTWKKNIFPSIFSFHQANTDGQPQQIDCIYSESAIERLFLGGKHSEEKLVQELMSFIARKNIVFVPITGTTRNWQTIRYKDTNGNMVPSGSIFEAWIRELVRERNRFAHGGHSQGGTVWSLQEHLLLSAFIYPLLLKLYVSGFDPNVTFNIDPYDVKKIRMFEKLLAEVQYHQQNPNTGTTPWSRLISDSRLLV